MKKRSFILTAVIVAFAISYSVAYGCDCGGCESDKASASSTELKDNGNVWVTITGEEYFTCPVMKTEMKVADAKSFSVVDGKKFYHCCPGCETPFQSNPTSFLNKLNLPGNVLKVDADGKKYFRDPVSGVEMEVNDQTVFVDRNNIRYFFSSAKTMKTFSQSPEKYFSNSGI